MQVFISVIVFILGLGVVICLHEAGHLSMAKLFKVYCEEFSIGFGPKLVSINPKDKKTGQKKWETTLNLRLLPVGGYVSMAGEDDDAALTEAGIPKLDRSRTFAGISHPKQAIIMVAGITVNIILSFFLFLAGNLFAKQQDPYTNRIAVVAGSRLAQTGLVDGDRLVRLGFSIDDDSLGLLKIVDGNGNELAKENWDKPPLAADIAFTLQGREETDVANREDIQKVLGTYIVNEYYQPVAEDGAVIDTANADDVRNALYFSPTSATASFTVDFDYLTKASGYDGNSLQSRTLTIPSVDNGDGTFAFGKIGLGVYYSYVPWSRGEGYDSMSWGSFGRSIAKSFVDQGQGIANVYTALGGLFTPAGWKQVGGIISIFTVNEQAVGLGAYYVLWLWGLISVNLAVMNLLPLPGLDGWQLLLCIIEGVRKKPLPARFKQIASFVGLGILFALMAVLVVLDIIRLIA